MISLFFNSQVKTLESDLPKCLAQLVAMYALPILVDFGEDSNGLLSATDVGLFGKDFFPLENVQKLFFLNKTIVQMENCLWEWTGSNLGTSVGRSEYLQCMRQRGGTDIDAWKEINKWSLKLDIVACSYHPWTFCLTKEGKVFDQHARCLAKDVRRVMYDRYYLCCLKKNELLLSGWLKDFWRLKVTATECQTVERGVVYRTAEGLFYWKRGVSIVPIFQKPFSSFVCSFSKVLILCDSLVLIDLSSFAKK